MDTAGPLYKKMSALTNGRHIELLECYVNFEREQYLADDNALRVFTESWLKELGDETSTMVSIWAITIANMSYRIMYERAAVAGIYDPHKRDVPLGG